VHQFGIIKIRTSEDYLVTDDDDNGDDDKTLGPAMNRITIRRMYKP
jgi:hypothetical protein